MKLVYFIILISTFLNADIVINNNQDKPINILNKSYIYIDNQKSVTIEDIKKNNIKFIKNDKENLKFGYSPNIFVWIKFTILNNTNSKLNRIIEYNNILTTNIEFYNLDENTFIEEGLLKTDNQRSTLNPIFGISLKPFEKKTYYVKAHSHITSLIVDLNLWEKDKYSKNEIKKQMFYAFFFGAMSILILYNIFIFLFIKEISYLYYVFYLLGIVVHHILYIGYANLYFFNPKQMSLIVENASLFIPIPVIFLSLFTKSFLHTNQYKKLDKIFNILIILLILSVLVFLMTDFFSRYRNLFAIILMGYVFLITLYATIKKNKQAYFILVGWFVILIAGSIMYFTNIGFIDSKYILSYTIEISFLTEALIFSIALAKKIDYLQKEKNIVKEELLYQKSTENIRLEEIVEKKTEDLKLSLNENETLLKELNHRVKNNLQTIISLLRIELYSTKDETIKELLNTIHNRVNSISEIHQILLNQDSQSHINTKNYFLNLVNAISLSYARKDIELKINCISLRTKDAIYCGLIVNELVTNSFKYAENDNGLVINISLSMEKNKFLLCVKDNGEKNIENDNNSVGLILVESLATQQLGGNLSRDISKGIKTKIIWE